MDNCIFCKIGSGEIPSKKFYEDDDFFIISDINPKAKRHYLLIPKRHYSLIENANDTDMQIVLKMLKKVVEMQHELGLEGGYRVQINQGENGGQEVPHLHIHILGGEKLN